MTYLKKTLATPVPQSEPLDAKQVRNSAGGFSYAVDKWTRLDRFLILGSEGGSYYASQRKLTLDNVDAVKACLAESPHRLMKRVVEISKAGRAPKNDPAILTVALMVADKTSRIYGLQALHDVCRTGTHLLHFMALYEQVAGSGHRYGRSVRDALAAWYTSKKPEQVAYQMVKYAQRDGWAQRDVLRLAHPKPVNTAMSEAFRYAVKGEWGGESPEIIKATETLKVLDEVESACAVIREYKLPREAVEHAGSQWLQRPEIWRALLPQMPMEAMIRNLGVMTSRGVLNGMADETQVVIARLNDEAKLHEARIHPIKVLAAMLTYASGSSRGGVEWKRVPEISRALESAFYKTFQNVEPTGKRWLYGLDVSGSMASGEVGGISGLSPRLASAAMALVLASTETRYEFMAFTDTPRALDIQRGMRIEDALMKVSGLSFGATDCAMPMWWAHKHKLPVDGFVVLTDSETWAGRVHPAAALRKYREETGIDARLVVVGMVSNGFTIADPSDPGMLDVVGFDTATPALIGDFVARRF
jgi:60 kDa SS-A/Ro ribonucleoprotein